MSDSVQVLTSIKMRRSLTVTAGYRKIMFRSPIHYHHLPEINKKP